MDAQNKGKKLKMSVKLGWSSLTASAAVSYTLIAYFTLYASDVIGLDTGTVGILLMISKVFDAFTDLVAGFIIDRTHTRFGKARPYALAIIFYWISLAALFSIPVTVTQNIQYLYVFVMYTLANSVFATLYNCADPVHMANALEDPSQSMALLGFSGVLSTIVATVAGIVFPQLASGAASDPAQWSKLIWTLAIPLAVLGSFRFFVVKERKQGTASAEPVNLSLKETVDTLRENKYILLLSVLVFLCYLGAGLLSAVSTYYAKYVLGNLSANSLLSLTVLPVAFVMMLLPVLAKKFTLKKVMNFLMILGLAGNVLKLFNTSNVWWVLLWSCFGTIGFTSFYGFTSTMVLDCMDYGEYKTGRRVEGVMGSVQSFMSKVGSGLSGALVGIMLSAGGYVGTAETQTQGAIHMVIALYTVIPAAFCLIFLLIHKKYDLEKQLPEIREELKSRKKSA